MPRLTTRFGNFVQWFRRGSKGAAPTGPQETSNVATMTAEQEEGDAPAAAMTPVVVEPPARKSPKENAIEKLQRGYEELVDMMGHVRCHLAQQSERSERLINMLEGLPEALRSLPEATRNQTRTLETIQTSLSQQSSHNARLAEALNGLARTTSHHEQAMSAIGQQLDASHQRSEQILSSFTSLSGTLGKMSDANEASTGLLRRITEQESQAADQVKQLIMRNQKHMTTMSVVSWSLALVALTVASYVAVSVGQIATRPMPAATPAVAPVAAPVALPQPQPAVPATAPVAVPAIPAASAPLRPLESDGKPQANVILPFNFNLLPVIEFPADGAELDNPSDSPLTANEKKQ